MSHKNKGSSSNSSRSSRRNDSKVQGLASKLEGVASVAKGLGIDTSRSDAMVAQTRAQGSRAFKGSSFDSGQRDTSPVITGESLAPNTPITLPQKQVTTVPDFTANNVGFTGGTTGLSTTGNQLVVNPETDTGDRSADIFQQFLDSNQDAFEDRTTGADIQRKLERDTDIKNLRQIESNLSGQLNTITANRDAAILSLEGQGRGQTAGFIGGEQARINREAAIKALPIQAQLANAQGNVALAQDHINTWGKILMDDANNEYKHQLETNERIFTYLTDAEKRRLDAIEKQDDRAYLEKTALITAKTNAISNALGQGAPASIQTAIQNATTLEQVAVAAGRYNGDLLAQEAQRASIEASRVSTAKNKAELASIKAKEQAIADAVASGQIILSEEQQKTSMALGKQFEDESKNFKIQVNAYNQILASAEDPSAAGDLSLLFGYMKMLDPNSVVRETEFANAENAGGIPERIRAQWNKAKQGERLTEGMRADFVDRAQGIYSSALDQQIDLEDTFSEQGTNVYGLPKQAVDLIIRDIRAQGAVSDVAFGITLNNLSDMQLLDLRQSGLLTTPSGI